MEEIWKDISGFAGYQISNLGHVRSRRIGGRMPGIPRNATNNKIRLGNIWKLMKPRRPKRIKYDYIILRRDNKKYTLKIHRLVLETFVGPQPDGCVACHNDGDSYNNDINNLRWGTPRSNYDDAIKHGTSRGSRNGRAILSENDVIKMRALHAKGVPTRELAQRFGVCQGQAYAVVARRAWKHI